MALLAPGPRMDPDLAIPGRAIALLRRTLLRYPECTPACRRIWEARQISGRVKPNTPGPVGILHAELARIGWSWPSFYTLRRPEGPDLHLLETDIEYLRHNLREAARLKHYEDVSAERPSFAGAEEGIDKEASTAYLQSEPDQYTKGCIRAIIAGGV